jgi:subtilisin family serine protease
VVLSALLGAAAASAEPPAPPAANPAYVPGQIVVEWEAGAGRGEKAEARAGAEVGFQANLGDPAFQLVGVEPGQSVAEALGALQLDPAVAVAERDSLIGLASIPDDPLFDQQWGLENEGTGIDGFSGGVAGADIDAPSAWNTNVGSASTVVADIDAGYRFDSPDLAPVAWVNPGEVPDNEADDDGNGYVDDVHGYDFVGADAEAPAGDGDPTDDNLVSGGHGVHTAGIIGAAGDNGTGITGVAQDARIMALRACGNRLAASQAGCPTSSLIAAINYAGANGARVANLSVSGTGKSTALLNALAGNPETLFVAAAGNDAVDNDSVAHYPCDYEPGATFVAGAVENVICVAATDQADELASFSDWGATNVDLGAPGTEILSTYPAVETLMEEDFEGGDFSEKWKATGIDGGLGATSEAPLESAGMSDSPGAAPVAESSRSSTLANRISVPEGAGSCQLRGRDSVSLAGGSLTLIVFRNGLSVYSFQLPNTTAAGMRPFVTAPMSELDGSEVGIRFRYTASASPTSSSGVWLDDLAFTCFAPLETAPGYAFLQGTSMAAPHVSGAAALLFSQQPIASVEEVSYALLSSVDPDPSLAGKTVSGGRLDAARALAYLEPPAPVLSGTDPASPAEEAAPRIVGSVTAGSRVLLFAGAQCKSFAVATGTASELASPGLQVQVPAGTTEEFSAIVETKYESSPCSQPISYTNSTEPPDEVAPDPPDLSSTDPKSPAADQSPKILGSAESEATVLIYLGSGCGGLPVGEGSAAELASPGLAVAAAANSTTEFTATATDAAANVSDCSVPIAYVEDSEAPAKPQFLATNPSSPGAALNPLIRGAAEEGSEVTVYRGTSCGGLPVVKGSAETLAFPGLEVSVSAGIAETFSATATDAAGNTSGCSDPISYTQQGEAPPTSEPARVTVVPLAASAPTPQASGCTVPKVTGLPLRRAKASLVKFGCLVGKVVKPSKGRQKDLVVKRSAPAAGQRAADGLVSLTLRPKPHRRHH